MDCVAKTNKQTKIILFENWMNLLEVIKIMEGGIGNSLSSLGKRHKLLFLKVWAEKECKEIEFWIHLKHGHYNISHWLSLDYRMKKGDNKTSGLHRQQSRFAVCRQGNARKAARLKRTDDPRDVLTWAGETYLGGGLKWYFKPWSWIKSPKEC